MDEYECHCEPMIECCYLCCTREDEGCVCEDLEDEDEQ